MSYYDFKNIPTRTKSRSFYNDTINKSARSRSTFNMPHLTEFRRTKSSVAQRDIPELVNSENREDSFSAQFQKQILTKKSFLIDKADRQIAPTLIVRRKQEEKLKNPDRISLDHQNLTNCPILENEENLRLLNYQYNLIHQIQHLENLKKLILLDLYDNRIEKISGLDCLKSLRVLMLGRNRISRIEGLKELIRLDVLDLHANCLSEVENLNHLSELRVLNIAGNSLRSIDHDSLSGLSSLIELNARRNCIDQIIDITSSTCQNLQRFYLSYNNLMKLSDFSCLINLSSLSELSIDNNPICRHNNARASIIFNIPQLEQLDLRPITDEEKYRAKQVVNRLELNVKPNSHLSRHLGLNASSSSNSTQRSEGKSANFQKFHSLKDRRKVPSSLGGSASATSTNNNNNTNNNSKRNSITTNGTGCHGDSGVQSPQIKCVSSNSNYNLSDYSNESGATGNLANDRIDVFARAVRFGHTNSENSQFNKDFVSIEETLVRPKPNSSKSIHQKPVVLRPSSSTPSLVSTKYDNNKVSQTTNKIISNDNLLPGKSFESNRVLIDFPEIFSNNEELKFSSSQSLNCLDDREFWLSRSGWSNSVMNIKFVDIDFSIIQKYFHILKSRFPNMKKLHFNSCNFNSFQQINSLASLKRLDELIIDGNDSILSFKLLRNFVIFRLNHLGLKKFNDVEIIFGQLPVEQTLSRRLFIPLSTLGPNLITQLHLTGLITDTRRRELMHSSQSPPPLVTAATIQVNNNTTNSVSLDLVGKFGLLSSVPAADDEIPNQDETETACETLIDDLMKSVEVKCDFEASFHEQWLTSINSIMMTKLSASMLTQSRRTLFMQQQYQKVLLTSSSSSSGALTMNTVSSTSKKPGLTK